MIFGNTLLLGQRVLKQLIRDRRTIVMITIMPILITLIFGFAIGGTVENVPVLIIMDDSSQTIPINSTPTTFNLGNQIYSYLSKDSRVNLENSTNYNQAQKQVDNSDYSMAIFISSNFTFDVLSALNPMSTSSTNAQIDIYVDATEPSLIASVVGALQESLNETMGDLASTTGHNFGINIVQDYANGIKDVNSLDVAIPGVIALILNFLVLLFSTLLLVRENTYRTKARLFASPIRPREIIMGYSLALGILALVMSLSVMIISVLIFNVTVQGNIFELFLCILIFGLSFVFLGVFLSNFARNELQAVQMGPLIAFPSMAVSGFLVPVKILPGFLQPFAQIVPMTYGIKLFRGIMLKGYTIADMLPDFTVIVFIALLFLFLALISIKPTAE